MSYAASNSADARPAPGPAWADGPVRGQARERQVTTEIVEQLRKELSQAVHRAGMAEVATGTLHNVGNVLNSVSVSAGLVTTRLRESRAAHLSKALALLREHRQDLAQFLAEDPKGKMLPSYLETLAEHFSAEQATMLREMENLNRNLEHIKEIVAMQQSYAKMCGVVETLSAAELVEDALRMNLGAFERHGITVLRQFAEAPLVTVDRHKVLQILINLLRNAKYALDEAAPPEKRLTLSIAPDSEGRVLIGVRDNGVGIPVGNLQRIFEHGFTTKREGHGFGLHSGALAAQELGGRLTAQSDGPGKGAFFCLQLPAAQRHSVDPNTHHAHSNATRGA